MSDIGDHGHDQEDHDGNQYVDEYEPVDFREMSILHSADDYQNSQYDRVERVNDAMEPNDRSVREYHDPHDIEHTGNVSYTREHLVPHHNRPRRGAEVREDNVDRRSKKRQQNQY